MFHFPHRIEDVSQLDLFLKIIVSPSACFNHMFIYLENCNKITVLKFNIYAYDNLHMQSETFNLLGCFYKHPGSHLN